MTDLPTKVPVSIELELVAPERRRLDEDGDVHFEKCSFTEAVVEAAATAIVSKDRGVIDEALKELVEEKAAAHIESVLSERVAKLLDEGFVTYDRWGSKSAEVKQIPAMVEEAITARVQHGYGEKPVTVVEKVVKDLVDGYLRGEGAKAMKGACDRIKTGVDDAVVGKLRDTLKSALGLR